MSWSSTPPLLPVSSPVRPLSTPWNGVSPTRSSSPAREPVNSRISTLAKTIRAAVPKSTRVVIGSGATAGNLATLLDFADSVIVGTGVKVDNNPSNRVDST